MDDRFAFTVEWFDQHASLVRKYQFIYYSVDSTCEMVELKTKRLFLKRTKCPKVRLSDLFIGSIINIHGRQLTVTQYGDEFTRRKLECKMEKTIGIIMPDCVDKMAGVIERILSEGISICNLRMVTVTHKEAETLCRSNEELSDQLAYLTEGPVVVFELIGENVISRWRNLIGPNDPALARQEAMTSLRSQYGKDSTRNGFYGSIDEETANRDQQYFYSKTNRAGRNTAQYTNTTLCIVKPHAVKAGQLGAIINDIVSLGFAVTAIGLFNLEKANSEEFYEVYKGVVREYTPMVEELSSGPCVAMEIQDHAHQTQETFREAVGPSDPEIARHLRPNTLRAKYGTDRVANALHCTDLPEDQVLEVEYFFKILDS